MTDIEKRVFELANMIGMDTQPKSKTSAELKGFCAGLELISGDFAYLPTQLSPYTAQGYALDLFCSMFGIFATESPENKRQLIAQGFCKKFGGCSVNRLWSELNDIFLIAVSKDYEMVLQTIDGESIIFCGGAESTGGLLKKYLPPGVVAVFNGKGVTFDKWESLSYTFDKYDSLDLTFDLLDTIT